LCPHAAESKSHLREHQIAKHSNCLPENQEICHQCLGKTFKTQKELKKHTSTVHPDRLLHCSFPGCTYSNGKKFNVERHEKARHREADSIECRSSDTEAIDGGSLSLGAEVEIYGE
jgi:hypothetical protein